MKLRRLIRILHRDVGYLLAGMVITYAISGIAVNHVDAWNPSYATTIEEVAIGPLESGNLGALESEIVERLEIDPADVRGRHRPAPGQFVVFLPDGGKAEIHIATGQGTVKRVSPRTGLFEMNVLHLNHLKGIWTYVADAFSLLLIGLAVTGLFMLKGRAGLSGRGKWFVAAGVAVPVGFLILYHATR